MKDGTTHLAYKPEHAVDLDTGAVVAAELHPADEGDTTTLPKTLAAAQENLASVDAAPTAEDPAECVTDKGYHSRAVLKALDNGPWKTRIAEPKAKGFARWRGDEAARRAVTNNRTRLLSGVAKEAFKLRAEIVERSFAHNLDRGGMRRTWLRGRENVHKRYLLHVAGHNLSLLMRQLIGAGTPREAVAGGYGGIFVLLTPTGAMLVALGVFAKRPDGFRRRIPHLGVRAGKSHLINGLLRHDLARRLKSLFLHRRTPFQARNPSVFPHFETDILLKFKLMAAWPGNLAVATISAVELRHRWGAGRLLSGPKLKARCFENQQTEAKIGVAILNKMTELGRPVFKQIS